MMRLLSPNFKITVSSHSRSISYPGQRFFSSYSTRKADSMKQQHHISTKTDLVVKIKPEQKKSKTRLKRQKFDYEENHTAALKLLMTDEELERAMKNPKALLDATKENIHAHAERRVDLFFYTLIAYFQKNLTPIQGRTELQFGRGRNSISGENITQACHSSLFASFKDTPETAGSILSLTHFGRSLNATMELPNFVNKLDSEIEEGLQGRTDGLKIIQQVSKGNINPIGGLAQFFQMMQNIFHNIENCVIVSKNIKPYMLIDTLDSPKAIKQELVALTKEATFAGKWDPKTQSVTNDYIEMMLRLTKSEKSACKNDRNERAKCYERKIMEIQGEILSDGKNEKAAMGIRL